MNNFLNHTFIESVKHAAPPAPPKSPSPNSSPSQSTNATPPPLQTPRGRVPLTYVHTRERDSFYELPNSAFHLLPASVRSSVNPRHKLKMRVTTDQKTGKVLNKIIKARLADINVFSPGTIFDWRVSVNMEMPYDGSMEGLMPHGGGTGGPQGGGGERNKDRLSYKHLCFTIDLTQVTPAEVCLVVQPVTFIQT